MDLLRGAPRQAAMAALLLAVLPLAGLVTLGRGYAQQRSYDAPEASIQVDGDISDWAGIPGLPVTLRQFEGVESAAVPPIQAELKVAHDANSIYVLLTVADDFNYDPADHHKSAAVAVMFPIEAAAGPHMGTGEAPYETSLGMVDIWHWELDCGPGEVSGGGGVAGGNDPKCNFDDEYATEPEEREDDDAQGSENSLVGVWEHTARAQGPDAAGTWIFEMSRPLQTGDPRDAQFAPGQSTRVALAYWDADQTPDGWEDDGHLQSADEGWIVVNLVTAAAPAPTAAPATATPTAPQATATAVASPTAAPAMPTTGSGGLLQDGESSGVSVGLLALVAVGAALALAGGTWAALQRRR